MKKQLWIPTTQMTTSKESNAYRPPEASLGETDRNGEKGTAMAANDKEMTARKESNAARTTGSVKLRQSQHI
jgi:hypothetical protein